MKKIISIFALVLAAAMIAPAALPASAVTVPVLAVTSNAYGPSSRVVPDEVCDIDAGDALQLYAIVKFGNEMGETPGENGWFVERVLLDGVIWESADEGVASVDANGLVTGTGEGRTVITATLDGSVYNDRSFSYPLESFEASFEITVRGNGTPFSDVAKSAWYYEYVRSAFEFSLMKGEDERIFNPDGLLTRAMTATVIWRIAGEPESNGDRGFSDVPDSAWFADAVRWAQSVGIVKGVSERRFSPDSPITRADFAAMIHRYGDALGVIWAETEETGDPTDIDAVPDYAKAPVTELFRAGIVKGKGGGLFDPQALITRAETAAVLVRARDAFEESKTSVLPDPEAGETEAPTDGVSLLESLDLEYKVYAWIDRMPRVVSEYESENRFFTVEVKRKSPTEEPIPDMRVELRTSHGKADLLRTHDFPDECRFYVADDDRAKVFGSLFSDSFSGFIRFGLGEKEQTVHFSVSVSEVW